MWLVEGPFDGKDVKELDFKKSKLLKCGRSYVVSRKRKEPTYLVVNSQKVSNLHATLTVGEHTTANVSDTDFVPTFKVRTHVKSVTIHRQGRDAKKMEGEQECELQSRDEISLSPSVSFRVIWKPICCFIPQSGPSFSFEKCASLGIKLSAIQNPAITHHLTSTLNISSSVLCSVLRMAQIVKPDWLTECLRQCDEVKTDHEALGEGEALTMLEFEYRLPKETSYRPSFASGLPTSLKSFKAWEPNEERENMFRGWRMLFIGEKGREADRDLLDLLTAGGAEYEVFDVMSGERKWRQTLDKNRRKAKKGLCVVADEDMMQVAAEEEWKEISDSIKESDLRVVKRSKLLEAVLYVDTSRIDSTQPAKDTNDSLSNMSTVENTPLEEASNPPESSAPSQSESNPQPGPSRRPLRRRADRAATSKAEILPVPTDKSSRPSEPEVQPPANEPQAEVEEATRPRKPLVRRARTAAIAKGALDKAIVGVDDPSIVDSQPTVDPPPSTQMPPPGDTAAGSSTTDATAPPPSGRPGRLKRRRNGGEAAVNPVLAELEREIEQASQIPPPLKKFKALFDETNPDRLETQRGGILSNIDFSEENETGLGPTQMNEEQDTPLGATQTQTQTQTQAESRPGRRLPRRLAAVAEEVEESQSNAAPSSTSATVPQANADVDMGETIEEPPPNQMANTAKTTTKPTSSATLEPFSSNTQRPPASKSSKPAGAAPGKPDTDAVFLKAIASTKKGKKGEDDFDREFNNLRISKPEFEKDAEAKQWEVLADFGDDGDLRGNFMVILEMEVPERRERNVATRADWQGKPNYKRFKKKHIERRIDPVELVVDDENDYGMGAAYWTTGASQIESQSQSQGEGLSLLQPSQTQNKPSKSKGKAPAKATQTRRGRSQSVLEVESGSEAEAPTRKSTQATKRTKGKKQTQPLFLPDVDEEEPAATLDDEPSEEIFDLDVGDLSVEEDDDSPPPTKAKGRGGKAVKESAPTRRKRTAALMDDDGDTAFKGFGARKKTKT